MAFEDRFDVLQGAQDLILKAVSTRFSLDDLVTSHFQVVCNFQKDKFKYEAKFGLLQNAIIEGPNINHYANFWCFSDYASVTKAFSDFYAGR